MDNILEQIQSLTDKFNNLFEVEGLGDPSGDVPPSTNKIKKDKKTKDGKVELVSVEDELFPKEGNAKEQFRQKVIDKINGMIQGTATLEDLLQLVRSKQVKPVKEGFEGAIEILEDLMSAIEKKHGKPDYYHVEVKDPYYSLLRKPANKSAKLMDKVSGTQERVRREAINRGDHNIITVTKNERGEARTNNRRPYRSSENPLYVKSNYKKNAVDKSIARHEKKEQEKAPLKEAQEILEEIINEVSLKRWKEAAENSYNKRREIADKSAEADKENWDNYDKASRKHPEEEPALYRLAQANSDNAYKDEQRAKHAQKVAIVAPDNKHSANKYLKAAKNAADYHLEKSDSRKSFWQDPHAQKEAFARHKAEMDPVKSRASESFEQVISQIEGLINCLGESKSVAELPSVAKKVLPQREEEAKKAHASLDNVMRVNPYSMINGKLSQKQRDNIANALNRAEKADNRLAHAKGILNKPKEQEKSSGIKFDKILCNLEEAMNIIEATVGKLATSSVKSVEPRRKEYQDLANKAQKATGSDKVMLNAKAQKAKRRYSHALELNTLHLPKDSKVSANKLFKAADKSVEGRKRQDNYKRYRRAWNIADANPLKEAVEITENLYKEIDKKLNKGELSVDKALKLEKKVQDKISPEKREVDSKEMQAELKHSLEPEIQVNKTLKALRRDDKRRNQGKNNYKFTFDYKPKDIEEALKALESLEDKINKEYNKAFKKTNEGLFVNDGRGDLIDDISKCLTKKTVKQHIVDTAKKLINGKKKVSNEAFDSFKIKGYNEEELVKLVEEVINEISDGRHREKMEELKNEIEKAEEFRGITKDDAVKKKIDDIIIPQEHRLNVSQSKYDDRVVKREKEKYERSKAKKGK